MGDESVIPSSEARICCSEGSQAQRRKERTDCEGCDQHTSRTLRAIVERPKSDSNTLLDYYYCPPAEDILRAIILGAGQDIPSTLPILQTAGRGARRREVPILVAPKEDPSSRVLSNAIMLVKTCIDLGALTAGRSILYGFPETLSNAKRPREASQAINYTRFTSATTKRFTSIALSPPRLWTSLVTILFRCKPRLQQEEQRHVQLCSKRRHNDFEIKIEFQ